MKKMFVFSMLISFAMVCSCQKQVSTAEAQLAQRKTELDTREEALAERESALDERERALAEREKAIAKIRTTPPVVQGQTPDAAQLNASPGQVPDPAQLKAERDKRLQQLPPEFRALIPDAAQVQAQRDRMMQQELSIRQRAAEELQRTPPRMQNPGATSDLGRMQMEAEKQAATPATTAAPAAVYPSGEATSPSPSPTPQ